MPPTATRYAALLRGVTPTGKNRIPSMARLAQVLRAAGFADARTYIQSGNVVFSTGLSRDEAAERIGRVIRERIGADLRVILKTKAQLAAAARENPFADGFERSRVHLVFTNDPLDGRTLADLARADWGDERLCAGSECVYLYLPKIAPKKVLSTNFLERKLAITATMRKLSVVERLRDML